MYLGEGLETGQLWSAGPVCVQAVNCASISKLLAVHDFLSTLLDQLIPVGQYFADYDIILSLSLLFSFYDTNDAVTEFLLIPFLR